MKKISNLEFVILSLISEQPVHGYQIEQLIIDRGMREWTDIGFSSIYHVLGKLQKQGYLTCRNETIGGRPARNVFVITTQGSKLLHDEVLDRLSTPRAHSADFDLALICLPILSDEEIFEALESYRHALDLKTREVASKVKRFNGKAEPHVIALFDHSLHAMRSELKWITNYISKMEREMETNQQQIFKQYYSPSAKEPQILEIPAMNFLMIDGHGDPNTDPGYSTAVSALYTLSYTLKFDLKKSGNSPDYKVYPLQGLWWSSNMNDFATGNKSNWDWTMMIAQPEWITSSNIELTKTRAAAKVSPDVLEKVRFESYAEGTVVQLLHIGPYSAEGPNIARLHAYARENGYELVGKHHEIYLGDPNRSASEKLKTIIRQPIRKV